MLYQNIKFLRFFMLLALGGMLFFTSCEEDDETNENGDDNTNGEVWEPYQVKANTSYSYDFERKENEQVVSTGSVQIDIGDPEVEVTGTVNDDNFNFTNNASTNVEENFAAAVLQTPIGGIVYQPHWSSAFMNQEIEVGASWSFSYDDNSVSFEVTGTDSYAGIEGFIIETIVEEESEGTIIWETCVSPDVPLALMTNVNYGDGMEDTFELTNYSE